MKDPDPRDDSDPTQEDITIESKNISHYSFHAPLGNIQRDLLLATRRKVKDETRNISIIMNTALSAFTDNPINLSVVAQSSEGKTYTVLRTIEKWPKQYVWIYRKVSPKTFTRERGQLAVRVIDGNREQFHTEIEDDFSNKGMIDVRRYLNILKSASREKISGESPEKATRNVKKEVENE